MDGWYLSDDGRWWVGPDGELISVKYLLPRELRAATELTPVEGN